MARGQVSLSGASRGGLRAATFLVGSLLAGTNGEPPFTSGGSPALDGAGCAVSIVDAIDQVVNAAYSIVSAATDCTLPGLDELACAVDLTGMFNQWFTMGTDLGLATFQCGNLDNSCAASIMQGLADIADTSTNLIASATDCISDPFICVYDVFSAVNSLNNFVVDLVLSLQGCNHILNIPGSARVFTHVQSSFIPAGDDGGYFERRLLETENRNVTTVPGAHQDLSNKTKFMNAYMNVMRKAQDIHAAAMKLRGTREHPLELVMFEKMTVMANTTAKHAALAKATQAANVALAKWSRLHRSRAAAPVLV